MKSTLTNMAITAVIIAAGIVMADVFNAITDQLEIIGSVLRIAGK